jgi:catechol 2,3-dioxygenase-like lactoylglutathione lyase family enzyme
METVIAQLLTDFERGKMTRRQLIQSLALAATAAAAPASAAAQSASSIPPPSGPAPWKTVWLDHISYAVSDYRRSTAFYRDLMGWEIRNDNNNNQCTLKIGEVGEIIIRNNRQQGSAPTGGDGAAGAQASGRGPSAGSGQSPSASSGRGNRPPLTGVINHISWGVQPWDTDKVKAELERRGLNPRPDMVGDNFKSFHVLDPDGWDLQISNQTKDTRQRNG